MQSLHRRAREVEGEERCGDDDCEAGGELYKLSDEGEHSTGGVFFHR